MKLRRGERSGRAGIKGQNRKRNGVSFFCCKIYTAKAFCVDKLRKNGSGLILCYTLIQVNRRTNGRISIRCKKFDA